MLENGSKETIVTCEVGLDGDSCKDTEECVASNSRSRNGICKCKSNFVRNEENICIQKAATIGKSHSIFKVFVRTNYYTNEVISTIRVNFVFLFSTSCIWKNHSSSPFQEYNVT